jgi:hypothetical protein
MVNIMENCAVDSWIVWKKMDFYEHLGGLNRYMTVDESMDS